MPLKTPLPEVMEIPLSQGKVALVDKRDYKKLMKYKWCADKRRKTFYATRTAWDPVTKTSHKISMHRFIMNTPKGMETDHINGNGLDNRRSNLRVCTRAENSHNVGKYKTNTSGLKGVDFYRYTKLKWRATIRVGGKTKHLGVFATKELAHEAYCEAAKKYHGEFARTAVTDHINSLGV